jgi:hypothetical protein
VCGVPVFEIYAVLLVIFHIPVNKKNITAVNNSEVRFVNFMSFW